MKNELKLEKPTQEEPENLTNPSFIEDSNNIPKTSKQAGPSAIHQKSCHKQLISLLPQPNIIYGAPTISAPTLHLAESNISKTNTSVKDKLKNIILSNSGPLIDKMRINTEPVRTIFMGSVPLVATAASLIINSNSNDDLKEASAEVTPNLNNLTNNTSDTDSRSRKRIRGEKSEGSNQKVERNRAAGNLFP